MHVGYHKVVRDTQNKNKISEYDQDIPQLHNADKPLAPSL